MEGAHPHTVFSECKLRAQRSQVFSQLPQLAHQGMKVHTQRKLEGPPDI